MSIFETRWAALARKLKISAKDADDLGANLLRLYGAPDRHHHGIGHVEAMLERITLLKGHFRNPSDAELAAF